LSEARISKDDGCSFFAVGDVASPGRTGAGAERAEQDYQLYAIFSNAYISIPEYTLDIAPHGNQRY
jgi:hypothetical protein